MFLSDRVIRGNALKQSWPCVSTQTNCCSLSDKVNYAGFYDLDMKCFPKLSYKLGCSAMVLLGCVEPRGNETPEKEDVGILALASLALFSWFSTACRGLVRICSTTQVSWVTCNHGTGSTTTQPTDPGLQPLEPEEFFLLIDFLKYAAMRAAHFYRKNDVYLYHG